MRWPIYLTGFIMLVLGSGIVINPEIVRKLIDYIDGLKWRIYSAGAVRVILGILLIGSAGNARLYGFILTLGILITLAGIACFTVPVKSLAKAIAWYRDRSVFTYRLIGILALVLSSILLFAS